MVNSDTMKRQGEIWMTKQRRLRRGTSRRSLQLEEFPIDYDWSDRLKDPKGPKDNEDEPFVIIDVGDDADQTSEDTSSRPTPFPSVAPALPLDSEPTPSLQPSLHPTFPTIAGISSDTPIEQPKIVDGSESSSSAVTIGVSVSSVSMIALIMFLVRRRHKKREVRVTTRKRGVQETKLSLQDAHFASGTQIAEQENSRKTLAGTYKLRKSIRMNEFLEALGVTWAVRSAACSAKPVHTIFHDDIKEVVVLKFKGVPRFTYHLSSYGVTTENSFRERTFRCRASYLPNKQGFEVRHYGTDGGAYDLHLKWQLNTDDDGATVQLSLTALFPDRPSIACVQIYRHMGEF